MENTENIENMWSTCGNTHGEIWKTRLKTHGKRMEHMENNENHIKQKLWKTWNTYRKPQKIEI